MAVSYPRVWYSQRRSDTGADPSSQQPWLHQRQLVLRVGRARRRAGS